MTADTRPAGHPRAAARPRDDDDLRQSRLDRAALLRRPRRPTSATCSPCRSPRPSPWPTATRRPPATGRVRQPALAPSASATPSAASSPPLRNHTPLVITAGQQTRAMLPPSRSSSPRSRRLPEAVREVERASRPAPRTCPPPSPAPTTSPCSGRAGPRSCRFPRTIGTRRPSRWSSRQVNSDFVGDPGRVGGRRRGAQRQPRIRRSSSGPGVDRDGAGDLAVELAERAGATVWVSPLSSRCSFPEDHPAFAGFLTPQREPAEGAAAALRRRGGAGRAGFHVPRARRPAPVVADGTHALPTRRRPRCRRVRARRHRRRHDAATRHRPRSLAGLVPAEPPSRRRAGRRLSHRSRPTPMLGRLRDAHGGATLPRDAIVVEEAPSHRNALHEYLPIRHAGGFSAGASGGLGYALPASVGVALGRRAGASSACWATGRACTRSRPCGRRRNTAFR